MTFKLYYHPLASYCWKVLMALYESETPFEGVVVNLGNPDDVCHPQCATARHGCRRGC